MLKQRIGILAGTFDPIHKGHLAFALQALKDADLDTVYFLPERKPRRKEGVTHITHRVAMLKLALRPYPNIKVLELPDIHFSVAKTLPRLRQRFPDVELFFLIGADSELDYLPQWPFVERLLDETGLVIAERGKSKEAVEKAINKLPISPKSLYVLNTNTAGVSSANIRRAIRENKTDSELLPSIKGYIAKNWLYKTIP